MYNVHTRRLRGPCVLRSTMIATIYYGPTGISVCGVSGGRPRFKPGATGLQVGYVYTRANSNVKCLTVVNHGLTFK